MSTLKIHTIETAPEKSKPLLEGSLKAYGMVPGLHGVLASSPETFEAYQKFMSYSLILLLLLKN